VQGKAILKIPRIGEKTKKKIKHQALEQILRFEVEKLFVHAAANMFHGLTLVSVGVFFNQPN
jgi:hypothetical protein